MTYGEVGTPSGTRPGSVTRVGNRGRGDAHAVAGNVTAQVVTFGLRTVSGVLVLALLGRLRGPSELGTYTLAIAFTSMFAFMAGLGLQNLLVREMSRRPDLVSEHIDAAIGLVLWSGSAGVVLATIGSLLLPRTSPELWVAVALAALALVGQTCAALLSGSFYARERMVVETRATAVAETGLLVVGSAVIVAGGGALGLMASYAGSRLLMALWMLRSYAIATGPLRPRMPRRPELRLARRALPFCVDDLLTFTYIRVDVTLVQVMRGGREVGLYTAATLLVLTLNVLARVLNWSLYPRLCRAHGVDPDEFRATVRTSLRLLLIAGFPLAVGGYLLAAPVVDAVWGRQFSAAASCFALLTLVIPVRFLGHTMGTALTASDLQTQRTAVVGGAACLNVALNLWLIPRHGFYGAAVATVTTEAALASCYSYLVVRRHGPICRLEDVLRPAAAAAVMGAVVAALGMSLGLVGAVGCGGLVYAAAVLATRAVTPEELAAALPERAAAAGRAGAAAA